MTYVLIIFFVLLAGFFDGMLDNIKDETDNFLYRLCKGTKYGQWYCGWGPLPFFESRGYKYNPGNILLADAWHQSKHLMMLSFASAIGIAYQVNFYYTIGIIWLIYFIEGEVFIKTYVKQ